MKETVTPELTAIATQAEQGQGPHVARVRLSARACLLVEFHVLFCEIHNPLPKYVRTEHVKPHVLLFVFWDHADTEHRGAGGGTQFSRQYG